LDLRINDIQFKGSGPHNGSRVELFCENCGPSYGYVPIMPGMTVSLADVGVECAQCKSVSTIPNRIYKLERYFFDILYQGQVSKKQARRYLQKAEKLKDPKMLAFAAETINPSLAEATRQAISKKAFGSLKKVVKAFIWFSGIIIAGESASLVADDVYDRYIKREYFFQEYYDKNSQIENDTQNGTESGTNKNTIEK